MNAIGKHLAASAVIGIILRNENLLAGIAASILRDPDVIGVYIEDKEHNILYQRGDKNNKYKITLPVILTSPAPNSVFFIEQKEKLLGWINVYYTTSHLNMLIKNLFFHSLILAFVISFFMGAVVYFLVSTSFLKPFNKLLKAVNRISKGDLSCSISITKGMPETKQLAHAFNKMIMSLKNSQNLLEKTYKEMSYQKSLAEIGKISFIVAHEVKNPLGIIKGGIDILKKDQVDEETKTQMILYIEEEIKRLDSFIKEFLSLARPKRPEVSKIDLNEFMHTLNQKIKIEYPTKKIRINLSKDKDFFTDAVLLERVFVNLIKNAYEAGADRVDIDIIKNNKEWVLKIADNGPGICDEDKEKIFEPFYTTKPKGTGLGLVFVSQAVYALQGRIEVRDNIPKGNLFIIFLPCKQKISINS